MKEKPYIVKVSTGCTCCSPFRSVTAKSKTEAMEKSVGYGIPIWAKTPREVQAEKAAEFTPEI
ncbi:hypothetical protein CMI37_24725 [Candidatus Pacearchaeota archaeon]|nr:hypothetical protein [Candidatus Pacearchaeota archaeon]|tara:strand:+ start:320 stop:508 length:189 start_codon:yes stop_codon:yes gene_type:complete